ncbi:MAG TPA: non-homologous end-joining DNA ligase [Candidatus Sulfotelmatobacter sp.]|nr:non-homologous end-joining DNA ligase [Candidatus Sulfotelmatobacter sp.]
MKHSYQPMLAKEVDKPFSSKDWIFEIKWDGFRAIAYVNGEVKLISRNDIDLVRNFPEIKELKELTNNVVLDGEIVIIKDGKSSFQAVQERGKAVKTEDIEKERSMAAAEYIVFDILEKNGRPLINLPLIERKRILQDSVEEGEYITLSDFMEEKGEIYYQAAIENDLEGVIAKRKDSKYHPGLRSPDWLKIKKSKSCDCVIFGYTRGTGVRAKTFGALILGLYDGKTPVFVGKVGTGFSEEILQTLMSEFKDIVIGKAPFNPGISDNITWLKPKLVCEINYDLVTKDRKLRMPRFHALREDKSPSKCTIDQLASKQLSEYESKRNFAITKEPKAEVKENKERIFVVQEHHARNLHYDFRLENAGVLVSWAVPKGIPESTSEKRLAVQTEDHPIDYANFEGTIPEGQYGAGKVIIWDKGTFNVKVWEEDKIEFMLHGNRLKGRYVLVRLKRADKKNWLFLKGKEDA